MQPGRRIIINSSGLSGANRLVAAVQDVIDLGNPGTAWLGRPETARSLVCMPRVRHVLTAPHVMEGDECDLCRGMGNITCERNF
jgi:hypothetical protein